MSTLPLLVGGVVSGLQYQYVKLKLTERESVLFYATENIKRIMNNSHHYPHNAHYLDAVPMRMREHEYYTYLREGWNSKVFAFRDAVYDIFRRK